MSHQNCTWYTNVEVKKLKDLIEALEKRVAELEAQQDAEDGPAGGGLGEAILRSAAKRREERNRPPR